MTMTKEEWLYHHKSIEVFLKQPLIIKKLKETESLEQFFCTPEGQELLSMFRKIYIPPIVCLNE